MIYVLHEKSCGAVVFLKTLEETKYLLLQYEAGHWDFVKGNVEPEESEKETVLRELQEETGITDAPTRRAARIALARYQRVDLAIHLHGEKEIAQAVPARRAQGLSDQGCHLSY